MSDFAILLLALGIGFVIIYTCSRLVLLDDMRIWKEETANRDERMGMFNSVAIGMPYSQVVEIMGSNGDLLSEKETDNSSVNSEYIWKFRSRKYLSSAKIMFKDGLVKSKEQTNMEKI